MTLKIAVLAVFLTSTVAVAQETYKCKTPGGMVYQDRPCAGVRYAPAPATAPAAAPIRQAAPPSAAAPAAVPAQTDLERNKAYLAAREKERRTAEQTVEIGRLEESVSASQQARDAELAQLQARKGMANNNLAGATLEQGIATEMQAVNGRYAVDIGYKQDRLKQLRGELGHLK